MSYGLRQQTHLLIAKNSYVTLRYFIVEDIKRSIK